MTEAQAGDFVVAIDIGATKIALATADLAGTVLERCRLQTDARLGSPQAVRRVLAAARTLMAQASERAGGRCLGAGAVSPGIPRPDRIDLTPNMPGWEALPIADVLRGGLDLELVAVANDVNAAGEAEARWGSLAGADPGLYVSLGTGIGVALVLGGRALRGAHGAAGEVGYSLRGGPGERGAADGRAPLEEFAAGVGIGRRGSRLLGREVTAADVFALAETDARARSLVEETLSHLALHVANWAVLIDPERIAVGGGLMSSGGLVLPALERRLRSAVPYPPDIVAARFVQDAGLHGAIALALDVLERRSGSLPDP